MENQDKYQIHELQPMDYNMLKWYFSFRTPATCENAIVDSFLWKEYYRSKYIYTPKALIWLFENKHGRFTVTPLCKNEDLAETFEAALDFFHEVYHEKLAMYLVDEEAVRLLQLDSERFEIREERTYFDYVYDAQKLRTLSGKAYHKKKNHVNAFYKLYEGRYEYQTLTRENRTEVMECLKQWEMQREIQDEYHRTDYEYHGISYLLNECTQVPYRMGGIYVDGRLEAFSIGSYTKPLNMAYIHVEKANPEIRGLYAAINQQFLLHEFPNVEKVNREDDMGLEGLRKSKLSYHPIELVKKYAIIEK